MTKKALILVGIFALILVISLALANRGGSPQQQSRSSSVTQQPPQSTTGAVATPVSKDPQDAVPGLYPNPINNTSTQKGFTIASAMAENNTDPATGQPVSDHLELSLKNSTSQDLTNFEVYYTITDTQTNKQEGYYKKLVGFVLKAGQTQTINFDNKQGTGHFSGNINSIYHSSTNTLKFHVLVSTPGFKVQSVDITKAAGGAETKD